MNDESDFISGKSLIKAVFFLFSLLLNGSQNLIFPQKTSADLIIFNGKIHTVDKLKPRAEAVAISGNKILAVGTNKEISALANRNTKRIDAGGKLVLPGFNDSHVHFMGIGNLFSSINLRDAGTKEEVIEKLKHFVKFLPKNRWLLGVGLSEKVFDSEFKRSVDAETPENPILIYFSDTKTAFANEAALKSAGIDKGAKNLDFMRDESGEPNGFLKQSAINAVRKVVPQNLSKQRLEVAEAATNYAASLGVTSVQEMSADNFVEIYRQLNREGKLKTRIYDCFNLFEPEKYAAIKTIRAETDQMARGGCLKGFTDGDLESKEGLYKLILSADKSGWQVMIHAIGGAANDIALSVFERVSRENGAKDRRFRVEHAHNARAADLPRFGKSKIIASMQPHLFFGGARNGSEPYRTLLETNAAIAFGSDASITDFNPLFGIYAAVNGQKNNSSDQTISVEEAVRLYTLGAAYAEFQEDVKGSISKGKLADIVILSDDIFSVSPDEIRRTKVLTTIVDGKIVYEYK